MERTAGAQAFTVYISPTQALEDAVWAEMEARGVDESGILGLEVYPGREEALVFVYAGSALRLWYRFEDLEGLLLAAGTLSPSLPSALYTMEGQYFLSLPKGRPESETCREFGQLLPSRFDPGDLPPGRLRCLCCHRAVEKLQHSFLQ